MSANTLQPRSARRKTRNRCPPFWFYRESIRTSVHSLHIVFVEAPSATVGISFLWCAIAVEARRRRAASASIYIRRHGSDVYVGMVVVVCIP